MNVCELVGVALLSRDVVTEENKNKFHSQSMFHAAFNFLWYYFIWASKNTASRFYTRIKSVRRGLTQTGCVGVNVKNEEKNTLEKKQNNFHWFFFFFSALFSYCMSLPPSSPTKACISMYHIFMYKIIHFILNHHWTAIRVRVFFFS